VTKLADDVLLQLHCTVRMPRGQGADGQITNIKQLMHDSCCKMVDQHKWRMKNQGEWHGVGITYQLQMSKIFIGGQMDIYIVLMIDIAVTWLREVTVKSRM